MNVVTLVQLWANLNNLEGGGDHSGVPYQFIRTTADGSTNELPASTLCTPVNPGLPETEYWQTDTWTTTWIDGTDAELGFFYAQCGPGFSQQNASGQSVQLYVHVDDLPTQTGPGLPDGGVLVHSFTTAYESFWYTLPAGLTSVAFTVVISATRAAWPLPGSPPTGELQTAVVGNLFVQMFPQGQGPDPDPDPDPDPSSNPDPTPPPYAPPAYVPPPDPYAPLAEEPADTDSGSASLLDLVRAFSSKVRRAVRIIDSHTIEMVNPAVPLPAGWTAADADSVYSSTSHGAAADLQALSSRLGTVSLAAGAQIVTDDVRLLPTTWRIPDRLPVYRLPSAPVQRITYTFSPTGFTAAVDFHFRDIPLEAKRS